jgi:ent-kaurenoic acid hydroxylase
LGSLLLLPLAAWHCTDAFYRVAFALKRGRHHRLPPGHMGVPFLGETLALLWYFKVARRPDAFIAAKSEKYGEPQKSIYRTHLFGSPTVVVCSPAANKLVLQSNDGSFGARRPAHDLLGLSSMFNVEKRQHARIRGFVVAAVNRPSSLRAFARVVQPRFATAMRSWADKGTITAATEIRKLTFENICLMFVSMEPSAATEKMDELFAGLFSGLKTVPIDFPGTPLHYARKVRTTILFVSIHACTCVMYSLSCKMIEVKLFGFDQV